MTFTPIPGYRMVRKEEYDQIMADKSKVRFTENLPQRGENILLSNIKAANPETQQTLETNKK